MRFSAACLGDHPEFVIASEAKQSRAASTGSWIASSPCGLLAMTTLCNLCSGMHVLGKPVGGETLAHLLLLRGGEDVLGDRGELEPGPDRIEKDDALVGTGASRHPAADHIGEVRRIRGQ
jgi:hypothetical protein